MSLVRTMTASAASVVLTFCLLSCASVQENEYEDIELQESKTFKNCTFEEAWEAAIRSVKDIGFNVHKRLLKEGFIYAQGKEDPDSIHLPPHMNIYIRRKHNEINVRCHVVIPRDPSNYEISSGYVDSFFAALYRYIR